MSALPTGIASIVNRFTSSSWYVPGESISMGKDAPDRNLRKIEDLDTDAKDFLAKVCKSQSIRVDKIVEITLWGGVYLDGAQKLARKLELEGNIFRIVVLYNKLGYTTRLEWFRDRNPYWDTQVTKPMLDEMSIDVYDVLEREDLSVLG